MRKCAICKIMKYYCVFIKMAVIGGAKYQEKHIEICYKCAKELGLELPHEGD